MVCRCCDAVTVGEGVSVDGDRPMLPASSFPEGTLGQLFGAEMCATGGCDELAEVTLPYAAREECATVIKIVFPEVTFRFVEDTTWELDESELDHSVVPRAVADGVSLTVTDSEITLTWEGRDWKFHGFEQQSYPKGKFKSFPEMEASYTGDNLTSLPGNLGSELH